MTYTIKFLFPFTLLKTATLPTVRVEKDEIVKAKLIAVNVEGSECAQAFFIFEKGGRVFRTPMRAVRIVTE